MSVDIFRKLLCKKSGDTSNFLECDGKLCGKCQHDGYCNASHLSEKQHAYIDSDIHSNIYLNACPGSGKTEVLGVKCAMEFERWSVANSGIAVLTFTNSAEEEMKGRISLYSSQSVSYPHYVGTFTSWLHGYIANPFLYKIVHNGCDGKEDTSLRIVDSDCGSEFLNAFKTKYSYGQQLNNIPGNAYHWDIKTQKFIFSGNDRGVVSEFDSAYSSRNYMKDDLCKAKEKFWKAGFFTYEDVDYLAYRLLVIYSDIADLISKRFPAVIVDECQDLSYAQLRILEVLHQHGTAIHLIGDLNQAIYEFRQIDINDTLEFIRNNGLSEMILDENYRSNQKIIDASIKIIQSESLIVGKRELIVSRPLIAILYKKNQVQELVNCYSNILNEEGLLLSESRISCLGNIDIIPSHIIELKSIRRGMTDERVIDTFSGSSNHDISITIETIHGCKGLSLDSVLFVSSYTKSASSSGAHWRDWFQHNEAGLSETHRLAYVAFSRAKHLLALGIPNPPSAPLSEADKQMLTDCGFEIVEVGI